MLCHVWAITPIVVELTPPHTLSLCLAVMLIFSCYCYTRVGVSEQIQSVMDCGVIPTIVAKLKTEDWNVAKELIWCLANITDSATPAQMQYFLECVCPIPRGPN